MPRPPSDRVDEAFEIWSTNAERNDTRTAQQLGIAQETVSYWHRKYGWDERWQEVTAAEAEMAVRQARQMMRQATPLIARRLLDIIGGERPLLKRDGSPQLDHDGKVIMVRGGNDKDAINAAKLLLAYNLGDPRTSHYEPEPDPVIDVPYASAATVHAAERARTSRRRWRSSGLGAGDDRGDGAVGQHPAEPESQAGLSVAIASTDAVDEREVVTQWTRICPFGSAPEALVDCC